jgi:hypothetical protein
MIDQPASSVAPAIDPCEAASRTRARYNAALRIVRRVHLFAGLLMAPWVFLYGVTGFLFNHPEAFPDREVRTAGPAQIRDTALERFATAPEYATRLVETLNSASGTRDFQLVDGDSPAFSRTLFVTAIGHGQEHSVRFDPESHETLIRSTLAASKSARSWPGPKRVVLSDSPHDRLKKGVPELLANLGITVDRVEVRNPPDVVCTIEHKRQRWRVAYNIDTGAVSAKSVDGNGETLSTRRFLTGMHLSFNYPSRFNVRWLWAVAVDLMAAAMIFWGLSGVAMWWQLKKLRGWGAITLAVSALIATMLALGMHAVLASRI